MRREGEVGHFHLSAHIGRPFECTGPHDNPSQWMHRQIPTPGGGNPALLNEVACLACDSLDEVGMGREHKPWVAAYRSGASLNSASTG
jgi:hypothetical protein